MTRGRRFVSSFLCRKFLWKIFFSLQENPSLIRYMGVRQMTKAGRQKQECSASARIYSITPWEVENMKRFAALILTLAILLTAAIPTSGSLPKTPA